MSAFEGVITAMVTPFGEDGGIDYEGAQRLAEHLIDNGSHGLVVAGTTGESPTLSDDEKLGLMKAVADAVGDRASLILGTGSNDTRHSAELTSRAAEAGAQGVLVVTPYYNKPNEAGLRAHFTEVAAATDLPVVLYNIPGRSVINMPPDLLESLAAEIKNVVAVKQANDDDLREMNGIDLLAGNDNVFHRALELGGRGGILVASHLVGPRMREIWDAHQAGEPDRAAELDAALQPFYAAMAITANPIPVKAGLALQGLIHDTLRLPMVPADDTQREAVRAAMAEVGLAAVSAS